jgi:hypothetical protein
MSWSVTGTSKTSTTARVSVAVVVVLTGLRGGTGVGAGRLTVVRLVDDETEVFERPARDVVLAAPVEATVRAGAETAGVAAVLSALLAETTVLFTDAQPARPRQAMAGRLRRAGILMGLDGRGYCTTGLALTTWVTTDLTLSTP